MGFDYGAVSLSVQGLDDDTSQCAPGDSNPVTVHGYHGCFYDKSWTNGTLHQLILQVPHGWLTMSVDEAHVSAYPDQVLKRIAASATFPRIDRPDTWFDADTALPR